MQTTELTTAITATNGRAYYMRKLDPEQVQFTDGSGVRHSFMAHAWVYALYEDAAALHFVGVYVPSVQCKAFYRAPFVRRITFAGCKTKNMRQCAFDGSGVAVPVSRKIHNNRVAAQARRERERARFAYAHAARAHK